MSRLVYQTASTMKKIYVAKVIGASLITYAYRIVSGDKVLWVDLLSLDLPVKQSERWTQLCQSISLLLKEAYGKFEINTDEFNSKIEYSDKFVSEVRQDKFGYINTATHVVPMELTDVMLFQQALFYLLQ